MKKSRSQRTGTFRRGEGGFSLLEIAIVLLAILILITIAVATYRNFRKKAITTEARTALHTIYKLQISHHSINDTYSADLDQLGFRMVGRNRYDYQLTGASTLAFTARATANIDRDDDLDVWQVNHTGRIRQISMD
jgi:Tfp pilus assembly protein PilE